VRGREDLLLIFFYPEYMRPRAYMIHSPMKGDEGLDSRRGRFHIVQDSRMPPVFVVVGMARGVAFTKVCGVSTEACQCRNRGGV